MPGSWTNVSSSRGRKEGRRIMQQSIKTLTISPSLLCCSPAVSISVAVSSIHPLSIRQTSPLFTKFLPATLAVGGGSGGVWTAIVFSCWRTDKLCVEQSLIMVPQWPVICNKSNNVNDGSGDLWSRINHQDVLQTNTDQEDYQLIDRWSCPALGVINVIISTSTLIVPHYRGRSHAHEKWDLMKTITILLAP